MDYKAPLEEMLGLIDLFSARTDAGEGNSRPLDEVIPVLSEFSRFCTQRLSPLNALGDRHGAAFAGGDVSTPPNWPEAYGDFTRSGWNAVIGPERHGGAALPWLVNAAITEMAHGANMAFALCPMLTQAGVEVLEQHAPAWMAELYLPKLVSGKWTGTMNLTEPQAGSDLAAVRARAKPDGNAYRLRGQKIFITYGEHDLAENIIHLVLARLPDAPTGSAGLSLFLVPKFVPDGEGNPGARNDVRCVSIEKKLGIHASPTCTMLFGEAEGALGWLVGTLHRGLECMFTMMNRARLSVALQAVGVADRALQAATDYAHARLQGSLVRGGPAVAIAKHPDVRRMLDNMSVHVAASRSIAYAAAAAIDEISHAGHGEARARHERRLGLLVPIAKGWCAEAAISITSMAIQVHGGAGYIEETGIAQYFRDARIAAIYEGTTGIQAIDLVERKISRDQGRAASELTAEMRSVAGELRRRTGDVSLSEYMAGSLIETAGIIDEIVASVLGDQLTRRAVATIVLEAFGLALSCHYLLLAVARTQVPSSSERVARTLLANRAIAEFLPMLRAKHQIVRDRPKLDAGLAGAQ